ncbi:MAG: response regulator [Clostridiales bacterium]|nr:response regulator [Clostridiales bacterium]
MYRVVLIDDEKRIVEGLRKVVRWEDFGCQVAGDAGDAVSGAALIRDIRPDILFTDIRMPGDDGLTMLAGLRSEFPDMQVVVLTGYREFNYAQEAIRLGVTRFLLKPSKLDEIYDALRTATERLGAQSSSADNKESRYAQSHIVNHAIEYMETHFADKLTLQEVADSCYVSQWHLSKLLNKHTNGTFYDALNEIRVREAKRLLADPKLRVGDIGTMVGYQDSAHFARVFKKFTGMSANEYRNSL